MNTDRLILRGRTSGENTGRWRFRTNWRGQVILQVEKRAPGIGIGHWRKFWRDASVEDVNVMALIEREAEPEEEG